MKKSVICLFLCCFLLTSEAQLVKAYGVKAGAVTAGQDWKYSGFSSSIANNMRWGIDIGGYIEWLNIPVVSIVSELHYVQKGFKDEFIMTSQTGPDPIGTYEVTPRIDYLSIPILVKLRMDLPSFSLYIIVGPRYDIMLSSDADFFGPTFTKSDMGITAGGGLESTLIPGMIIGLEFQYSMSLQDIYSTDLLKVRNQSMEFLLVVGF